MNIPRIDNFVFLYSEDRAFHLRKLEPNGSVCLDRFSFVRWYVDKEISLDSADEAESLVG